MKMHILPAIGGAVLALCASGAPAALLAQWTFETSQPTTAGNHLAENGVFSASSFASANTGGTYTSPVGNGNPHAFSSNGWNVGEYFQFKSSSAGNSGLGVAFDHTSSGTGPGSFAISYSTDGTSFTQGGTYTLTGISWSSVTNNPASHLTFDFSSVSALNNATDVYFRLIDLSTVSANGGTVAGAGTSRVDNFTISSGSNIPEPATLVGLTGLGLLALRRRAH